MKASVPTAEELRSRLEALRAARGFVLPHHGAMAALAPDLHDAYGVMYKSLTLTDRHLTPLEKEIVWLAILTAEREAIGTHHLELFRRHGGTTLQAQTIFHLVGYAGAQSVFEFVADHWQAQFADLDAAVSYMDGIDRLNGGVIEPALVHLALAAVHAALGQEHGVAAHIVAAYQHKADEDKLAEALSLIMWPAGVNRFVEACTVWLELMTTGRVSPSPRYQAWADMPGQGAFKGQR